MKIKPETHDLLKLTKQLVRIAGGQKFNCSPYDVARPIAEGALGGSKDKAGSKSFIKKNYSRLRAWVDENFPNCPKKMGVDIPPCALPLPSVKKSAATVVQPAKTKKAKPPKKTTLGAVVSYIKRADIDPRSEDFLLSFAWRATRMMALKQHGAICQCCGASAKTGAVIHVDHIKPRQENPELALDVNNLQVLCHECNHGKGNWDQTDWRMLPAGRAVELLH